MVNWYSSKVFSRRRSSSLGALWNMITDLDHLNFLRLVPRFPVNQTISFYLDISVNLVCPRLVDLVSIP